MKKVCVFGADGRTGVPVIKKLIQRGYSPTAFIYNEKGKRYLPEGVATIIGNVLDKEDVEKAVHGSDAVISVLGHIKGSDPLMQTKGMQNIAGAMKRGGVTRILSLTGTGARETGDTPSVLDRFLNWGVKLVDPERINDGVHHVNVLKQSDLDWTVLRVLKLSQNENQPTDYHLTPGGPAELLTSRQKVAHILVDILEKPEYYKTLPVSSKI